MNDFCANLHRAIENAPDDDVRRALQAVEDAYCKTPSDPDVPDPPSGEAPVIQLYEFRDQKTGELLALLPWDGGDLTWPIDRPSSEVDAILAEDDAAA